MKAVEPGTDHVFRCCDGFRRGELLAEVIHYNESEPGPGSRFVAAVEDAAARAVAFPNAGSPSRAGTRASAYSRMKTWSVPVFGKLVTVTIFLWALSAHAEGCRVLDPELQGSYAGPCVNGFAEGKGAASGTAKYEGGFKAGKKNGEGVKEWPNGDRYEGQFVDDRREGHGVYTWGRGPWAGERYDGSYAADRRNGYGEYRYASGDVYRGAWKDDVATGAPTPMMQARAKFEEESLAAVGKPGTKVCREVQVGIGGRDWERGVVEAVNGSQVGVRVGAELRWYDATAWLPCY